MNNNLFKNKSNEELCAIVFRLKSQLLEARFKIASGEMEKPHVIKQVRNTIAQVLTELQKRGFKLTIGAHGINLYETANNKLHVISQEALEKLLNAEEAKNSKAKSTPKVEVKKESKPAIKEATETEVVAKPASQDKTKGVK